MIVISIEDLVIIITNNIIAMTYKNAKTIFVAVLAIGLLGGSVIAIQDVIAQPSYVGADKINYDIPTFDNPDTKRATEIMEELNEITPTSKAGESISIPGELTPEELRGVLIDELQQLKGYTVSAQQEQSHQMAIDKQEKIAEFLTGQNSIKVYATEVNEEKLPIIGYYVDDVTGALVIHVDAMEFSDKTAKSVLKKVRSLVGSQIDVVVEPMTPIITQACSQTGNCEPAQAGVKISTYVGPCSVGFKASYDGKTGFMTAGHCTHGTTSSGIGQPGYVFWDHIGTAYANSLTGSSTTYDGLFVDANENISDKVYLNKDISYAGYASYLDGVVMEGYKTKGVSGVVLISSYNGYIEGVLVQDMALTNYVGQGGDSGGIVYGIVPSDHLLGTHTGKLQGYNYSVFSKQQNAVTEFPGLIWQFN